jgi:hypothetical protein
MSATRTHDAYYDAVKARFDALTQQQRLNIYQRIGTVKAVVNLHMYVMAIDASIALELTAGRPDPQPCPPINSQEVTFAELLAGACAATKIVNPTPPGLF